MFPKPHRHLEEWWYQYILSELYATSEYEDRLVAGLVYQRMKRFLQELSHLQIRDEIADHIGLRPPVAG